MSKLKLKYPDSRRSLPSGDSDQDHDSFDSASEDREEEEDEDEDHDDDVIRCVCGSSDDDGFSIQCEVCETWQHGRCVRISKKSVPDHYICKPCLNIRKKKKLSIKEDRSLSPQNRRKITNESMKVDRKMKSMNASKSQRLTTTTTKKRVHYDNRDFSSDNSSDEDQLEQPYLRNTKKKFQTISRNIMKEKIVQDLYVEIRRQWMESYSQSGKKLISSSRGNKGLESIIGMETDLLLLPVIPRHKVLPIKRSLRANYSSINKDPSVQHGVFADQGMPEDRFVLEVTGEATNIKENTSLGTPPAHVFNYPNIDLCLDTRHVGNDARYIRRSCRPNSELKSIILKNSDKDQMVHLGVYTKKAVDRLEEITIGWNWTNGHIMWKKNKEFRTKGFTPPIMDSAQKKSLKHTLNLINTEFGECACEDEDKCLFVYLEDELERAEEDEDEDSAESTSSRANAASKRKRPVASSSKSSRSSKPTSATAAKVIFTSDEDEDVDSPKSKKTRPSAAKRQLKLKDKQASSPAVSVDGSVDIDITTMSPAPAIPSQPTSENEAEIVGQEGTRVLPLNELSIEKLPMKKRWLRSYLEREAEENNISQNREPAPPPPPPPPPPPQRSRTPPESIPTIWLLQKAPAAIAEELEHTVYDEGELSDGGSSQSTLPLNGTQLVRLQETAVLVEENMDIVAGDSKEKDDTTPKTAEKSLTHTESHAVEKEIKASIGSATSDLQQQTASTANGSSEASTSEAPAEVKNCETQAPKVKISLQDYLKRRGN